VHPWRIRWWNKTTSNFAQSQEIERLSCPSTCVYLKLNESLNLVVENKMLVGEFITSKKVNKKSKVGQDVTSRGSRR
jgi:hypothetical protein